MSAQRIKQSIGFWVYGIIINGLCMTPVQAETVALKGGDNLTVECSGTKLNSSRLSPTALSLSCVKPITDKVATPVITPDSGTYEGSVEVAITTATEGATIRYTLDGTRARASSPVYTGPFVLTASASISARAFLSGYYASNRANASLVVVPAPDPEPEPDPTPNPSDIYGGAVPEAILGNCSAVVHDRYVVTGPDSGTYRSWHPITVAVDAAVPNGASCSFAHDHGDDPTQSLANAELPPFGYIGKLIGKVEPHFGFKVYVAHAGELNDEGRRAVNHSRQVFHMTTFPPGRYDARFHSLIYDVVSLDGKRMHLEGMSDTHGVGSICDDPRQGKTVMSLGCVPDSPYEIWEASLSIGYDSDLNPNNGKNGTVWAAGIGSFAAFDPVTMRDPNDHTRLIYTKDGFDYFNKTDYHGCDREAYIGPTYWYNTSGRTEFSTDAYGAIVDGGPLKQVISLHDTIAHPNSSDGQTQFKFKRYYCAPSLGEMN